jgi:hypothetical protein
MRGHGLFARHRNIERRAIVRDGESNFRFARLVSRWL